MCGLIFFDMVSKGFLAQNQDPSFVPPASKRQKTSHLSSRRSLSGSKRKLYQIDSDSDDKSEDIILHSSHEANQLVSNLAGWLDAGFEGEAGEESETETVDPAVDESAAESDDETTVAPTDDETTLSPEEEAAIAAEEEDTLLPVNESDFKSDSESSLSGSDATYTSGYASESDVSSHVSDSAPEGYESSDSDDSEFIGIQSANHPDISDSSLDADSSVEQDEAMDDFENSGIEYNSYGIGRDDDENAAVVGRVPSVIDFSRSGEWEVETDEEEGQILE
jgi:hypothetical protein